MLDPYVLFTFKGIQQRGALPAQERGSQKLLRVLDPYVLLTFKGIQQRGASPAQERSSQKLRGCWILTSSLLLKRIQQKGGPASPRERLQEAAGGAGSLRPHYFERSPAKRPAQERSSQKLPGVLDPYVLHF